MHVLVTCKYKQVAQRATIAHLSQCAKVKSHFKKYVLVTKEQASMETSLSHYNSLEYFSNTQGPLIPQ